MKEKEIVIKVGIPFFEGIYDILPSSIINEMASFVEKRKEEYAKVLSSLSIEEKEKLDFNSDVAGFYIRNEVEYKYTPIVVQKIREIYNRNIVSDKNVREYADNLEAIRESYITTIEEAKAKLSIALQLSKDKIVKRK